jgi:hypothetical protein
MIFHHPGESSIDESIFNAVGMTPENCTMDATVLCKRPSAHHPVRQGLEVAQ